VVIKYYHHVELCKEQFKEYLFSVIVYIERKTVLRMFFGHTVQLKWCGLYEMKCGDIAVITFRIFLQAVLTLILLTWRMW
jgi:hypothetical protein